MTEDLRSVLIDRATIKKWDELGLPDRKIFKGETFAHSWPDGREDVYSIDIALELLKNAPMYSFLISECNLSLEKHRSFNADVDETFAMTTDLSKPVIFAPLSDGTELCIDGHHRIRRALLTQCDELYCLVLSALQKEAALIIHFPGRGG